MLYYFVSKVISERGANPIPMHKRTAAVVPTVLLHAVWWSAAVASTILALFSHGLAVDVYEVPCSGNTCRSFLQLSTEQFGHLAHVGVSPELYGGFIITLLTIQNVSALAIGFLVYRYGWRDAYSVAASLLILVTGTIFSTDDSLLGPALQRTFGLLNEFGSLYLFFFFLFPDGKFSPRWTVVPAVVWLVPMACSFWLAPGSALDLMTWPPVVKNVYMLAMHGLLIAAQAVRFVRGAPGQRRIIGWFLVGMGMYVAGGVVGLLEPYPNNGISRLLAVALLYGGLLLLPLAMGMAVLEYRLRRMAIAFNRTIVHMALTVLVVLAYALIVGLFGLLLQDRVHIVLTLLATGFLVLLGQPVRERVQQAVNRLVYGVREDPYSALSGLVQRLEGSFTHRSLIASVAERIASSLRLSYVAIEAQRDNRAETLAEYGVPGERCTRIPLTVQGEVVGRLALGVDSVDELLPPGKHRLLDDLINHVSIAVQATRLTEELHRSRERLVGAREEERRRLRRDLHDGLGSGLASMMLRLDQALALQAAEPAKTEQLLREVQAQLRESIADIRRLVYALRPPALDEFGLLFALRELTLQFEHSGTRVELATPNRLPKLDAAVEVALYRIAQEAITNAVRHAEAGRCCVRLEVEADALRLDVVDDGRGLPPVYKAGIGIRSMKERAEELGGTCKLKNAPAGGVQVTARLPLEIGGWNHGWERWREAEDHAG